MATVISTFGNSSSDALSHTASDEAVSNLIDNEKWETLFSLINTERARRGRSVIANPDFTGTITSSDLNALITGVTTTPASLGTFNDRYGYLTRTYYKNSSNSTVYFTTAGAPGGITGVGVGTVITASHINQMIDKLQAAGSACVCNCNYCTCNCNYCTCNCNYSCTCNCNYSDKRLKKNIKFIGKQNGINIYEFNYKWSGRREVGVMAQEILETPFKGAVELQENGYYKVDYSKLPINLKGL